MAEDNTQDDQKDIFLEALTKWEREFDAAANKSMGNDIFSAWMNQAQQSQLAMQQAFAQFMTPRLKEMNIPTRDDVIRLGEGIRRLDERMEKIEEALNKIAGNQTKRSVTKPKRTKKPQPTASGTPKE